MKHIVRLARKYALPALGAVALATVARAEGEPDLSAVTTGVTGLKTAVLAAGATVIAAGIALAAVKFGGKWVLRLFKSFSS